MLGESCGRGISECSSTVSTNRMNQRAASSGSHRGARCALDSCSRATKATTSTEDITTITWRLGGGLSENRVSVAVLKWCVHMCWGGGGVACVHVCVRFAWQ